MHELVSSKCPKDDYNISIEIFVKILIRHDVNLDVCCPVVGTALTKSLLMGKYRTAQFLIQMGADVNKMPEGELTSFRNLKIALRRLRYPLVQLLIAAGYVIILIFTYFHSVHTTQ